MDLRTNLILERCKLLRKIEHLTTLCCHLPEGQIHFDRNGRYWKWRLSLDDPGKTSIILSKNQEDLARDLAKKRYLTTLLEILRKQVNMIDEFILQFPDMHDLAWLPQESCPDYKRLLLHSVNKRQQFIGDWLHKPYESCPDHPEQKIYRTQSGVLVRSKSEVIIADALYDAGIPFHYEQLLQMGEQKTYPDFTILEPTGLTALYYWEHYGMMDVSSYARRENMKHGSYTEAGLIASGRMISTYESREHPLDADYVRLLIGYHFGGLLQTWIPV